MRAEEKADREFGFWEYFDVLRKRRRTVLWVALLVLALTAVVTFVRTPVYRATTTLLIEREAPLSVLSVPGSFPRQDYLTFFTTQQSLIRSQTIARRVVESLDLSRHPQFAGGGSASFLGGGAAESDEERLERAAGRLQRRVEVTPIRDSNIVEISFLSPEPEMAARVANALGQAYIDFNLETRYLATEQANTFLASQIEDLQRELEEKQNRLQSYGREKDIIGPSEGQNITNQRLVDLNQSYTAAQTERIRLETYLREIQGAAPESILEVHKNPLIVEQQQQLSDLETSYARMSKRYKDDWPEMARLRSEIEKARLRFDESAREIHRKTLKTARTEYETALENERSLERMLEEQKGKAIEKNVSAIQYNSLLMEVESKTQLLQSLLQRHSETSISTQLQSLGSGNIRVVDPAVVPREVYRPNKQRSLAIGLLACLLLGAGGAFLLEFLDRTVKSSEEINRIFGLPALGLIPSFASGSGEEKGRSARRPASGENRPGAAIERVCQLNSQSLVAEAYRSLRTSLLLANAGRPPRVVVVTSPQPGEGKTSTAVNLAVSLAQMGRRVLLIDADLRRARIHKVLGVDGRIGLSQYLAGMVPTEDLLHEVGGVPGLFAIAAGPAPPDPSELISSPQFSALLQRMTGEGKMDHVILDSPPILSVADPLILGASADGVILVVHGGVTTRDALSVTRDRLAGANVRILGVVVNNLDLARNGTRYAAYYHYRYGPSESAGQAVQTAGTS